MDTSTELRGRIEALEFIVTALIADAMCAQPDIGRALAVFKAHCVQKAEELKAEAAFAGYPDGWGPLSFADALVDRTREIVELTATIAGGAGHS